MINDLDDFTAASIGRHKVASQNVSKLSADRDSVIVKMRQYIERLNMPHPRAYSMHNLAPLQALIKEFEEKQIALQAEIREANIHANQANEQKIMIVVDGQMREG